MAVAHENPSTEDRRHQTFDPPVQLAVAQHRHGEAAVIVGSGVLAYRGRLVSLDRGTEKPIRLRRQPRHPPTLRGVDIGGLVDAKPKENALRFDVGEGQEA